MHEKLEKKTEESINKILEEGITTNNLDHLYKLTKINHIAKDMIVMEVITMENMEITEKTMEDVDVI